MKLRYLLFIVVVCLTLTICPLSSLLAYQYDPPAKHWDTTSVYYDDSALNSTWRLEIWDAKASWSGAGSNFRLYQSTGSSDNDLSIGYVADPDAGATTWSYFTGSHIYRCITIFNEDVDFNVGSNVDIETVALHEFGHWLYLDNIDGFWNTTKVMYGIYNGVKTQLAQDDKDGIIYIYGSD